MAIFLPRTVALKRHFLHTHIHNANGSSVARQQEEIEIAHGLAPKGKAIFSLAWINSTAESAGNFFNFSMRENF
jgi:hypothetical protein